MNWETIKSLVSPAITIAILSVSSLLSATVADGVISDHHDSNTELIAQGLANIASHSSAVFLLQALSPVQ